MFLEEECHKLVAQALTHPEKSRKRVQRKECATALQPGSILFECVRAWARSNHFLVLGVPFHLQGEVSAAVLSV